MYCEHFQLQCLPFENRADARFFYETPEICDTLGSMGYAANYGQGVALVLGAPGTGKTVLTRVLLGRLAPTDYKVVLTVPEGGRVNLVREVAKGFGVPLGSSHQPMRLLDRLRRYLMRVARAKRHAVLLIDRTEVLSTEGLQDIVALHEVQGKMGHLLHMILMARPELVEQLQQPQFERLAMRMQGKRVLKPFTLTETVGYVQHRLRVAGLEDADLLTPEAVQLVHEVAQGNPRRINDLCHAALCRACEAKATQVDRALVQAAIKSLSPATSRPAMPEPAEPTLPAPVVRHAEPVAPTPAPVEPAASPAAEAPAPAITPTPAGMTPITPTHPTPATPPVPTEPPSPITPAEPLERLLATRVDQGQVDRAVADALANVDLTPYVKRLLERAEDQIEQVWAGSEERLARLEGRLGRVNELWTESGARLEKLEEAFEHADDVKAKLSTFATELAARIEETQSKVSLLMSSLEAGDSTYERLEALAGQVTSITADAESEIDAQRARLRDAIEDAQKARDRLPAGVMEEIERRSAQVIDEVRAQIPGLISELSTAARAKQQELRSTIEQAEQTRDDLADSATQTCRNRIAELEERIESCRRSAEGMHESAGARMQQMFAELRDVDARTHETQAGVTKLCRDIESAQTTSQRVLEETKHARGIVDDLTTRAGAAVQELATATQKGGSLVDDVKSIGLRIEALQRSASESLTRVEDVSRRSAELDRQASECARLATQLQAERESAGELIRSLKEQRVAADEVRETVLPELRSVQDASGQLRDAHQAAQEIITRLSDKNDLSERLAQRLDRTGQVFERQLGTVSEQLANINTTVEQAREMRRGLQTCSDELGTLLQQSTTAVGTLRDRVEETRLEQAKAEQINCTLHETISVAGERSADLDQKVKDAKLAGEEAATRLTTGLQRLQQATEQAAAGMDQKRLELDTRHAEAQQQLEHAAGAASRQVSDKLHELRNVLRTTIDEFATCAADQRSRTEASLAELTDNAVNRAESAITQADDRMNDIAVHVTATLDELQIAERSAHVQREQLTETCHQAGALHGELIEATARSQAQQADAQQAQQTLDDTIHAGRQLDETMRRELIEATEKIGQLDSHHAAATGLVHRLGAANVEGHSLVEQLSAAQEQIPAQLADAQQQTDVIRAAADAVEQTAQKCADRQAEMEQSLSEVAPAILRVQQHLAELGARQREAAAQADEVSNRSQAAREVLAALEEANDRCQSALAHSGAYKNEIIALGATTAEQLTTMRELLSRSGEQHQRLEQTHGAVQDTLARTDTSRDEAAALIDRLEVQADEARQTLAAATRRVDQLTADARQVEQLTRDLHEAADPARELHGSLTTQLADARSQSQAIEQQAGQTKRFLERLTGVTQTLATAQQTGQHLAGIIDEGRALCLELQQTSERVDDQQASLHVASERAEQTQHTLDDLASRQDAAQSIVNRLEELNTRGEELGDRLAQQCDTITEALEHPEAIVTEIERHAEAMGASQQMLSEFLSQSHDLAKQLQEMRSDAGELRSVITNLTARPNEIAAKAQEQAAHLERVCGAVRKVFSGLSQAALHSNRQTDQFKQISRDTMSRLGQLKQETEQAAGLLNEWVDEAHRVQQRLERTLGAAPSLSETHSTGRLYRLSRLVQNEPGVRTMDDSDAGMTALGSSKTQSPARSRQQEVADMLREVKQPAPAS